MKLSPRMSVLSAEGAYAVLSAAQLLERRGISIIHLEIGQPDFPTPALVTQAAIRALRAGKTKYTPPLGIPELRSRIAEHIAQRSGIRTEAGEVAVTPSGKTALFAAFASLVAEGDEVLYPDPGFPTYRSLIRFFGGIPKPIPLREDRKFAFDMTALRRNLSPKTKCIVLNSPSNPTGGIIPNEDLVEIARLIREKNIWVVSDEIYSQVVYPGSTFRSIYSVPGMKRQTIIADGFSKTFSMTGWRLGFLVVPQPIIERVDYLLTHSVGCTASFTQEAGIAALTGGFQSTGDMVRKFQIRRDYIVAALNKISGVHCELPSGAFYVFPNIKNLGKSSADLASYLLQKGGVAVLPGSAFGRYGEGYLRLSYAASMEDLREGVRRINNALKRI